ncbi:SusC/RagA family TonB-linked outer membrane protein [Pedobacter frigoris]|uniref:SusC/RagA family TonB-linked outer membrane protein n=1 Tax=Pedobacter frigoris TaxID=2571272 RepID=UPI00292D5F40|nr:SusC/RagA family TonB-linked outer membrane protein [Pedobacter frigoris]
MAKDIYIKKGVLITILLFAANTMYAQQQTSQEKPQTDTAKVYRLPNKSLSYPVLYGQEVKDEHNISSLGYLKGKELETTPSTFIYYPLTGRIAGLATFQSSGIPGADNVTFNIRGRSSPIVLVDGVVRPLSSINPEQIESVTILKDALSLVTLGQRSMNNAVLFTTKKGNRGADYFNFNVKAQYGVQSPVSKRAFLNAYDYATLYNEGLGNEGQNPLYSQQALNAYKNQTNPFLYPDVDWRKQLYKKNAGFNRYTLNAEGRAKSAGYFVSLDYLDQKGLLNESANNLYSTNTNYKRYIFRSNINLDVTKDLAVFLNIFGRINTGSNPGNGDTNGILNEINNTPNNAYPVFNPNGSLGGNSNYTNNLWGRSTSSGYSQSLEREGYFDTGFKYNLNSLVEGLWLSSKVSYSNNVLLNTNRSKAFEVFNYSESTPGTPSYTQLTTNTTQVNTTAVNDYSQQFYAEAAIGYSQKFGKEEISTFINANLDSRREFDNGQLPNRFKTLAGSFKFIHDDKYIAEVAASYAGNDYYLSGKKAGFFPAAGLGWNLHKEGFMQSLKFFNTLKIRGSYGLTANSESGYYTYQRTYIGANGYVFNNTTAGGIGEGPLPYVRTYAEALKANIGLDMTFAAGRGWFAVDYFNNKQSNLLGQIPQGSDLLGMNYPQGNIGKNTYTGYEFNLGWTDQIGGRFKYEVSANLTTLNGTVTENGEAAQPFSWLQRNGQNVNQIYGYIADGFVTAAGQGPVVAGYQSIAGDVKYKDLDGNGYIDQNDVTAIGNDKPIVFYGLNTQLSYDRFYLSFLFQGMQNSQVVIGGNTVLPFTNGGKGQAYPHNLERWTPETAATASFPRISIGNNLNNYATSSLWVRNTNFIRLKNLEIGYNLSNKILEKAKIRNIRLFANGVNLFTISPFKFGDPEMPATDYSLQKVINTGLSVTF